MLTRNKIHIFRCSNCFFKMALCLFIWYFHSNTTILCLKSNKMRHNQNEECTTANRSEYVCTQDSGSLETYKKSLHGHRKTIRPVFIWDFHSNEAIICLKSNQMRHHSNEKCTTSNRSEYVHRHTQAGGSLDIYQTSLHGLHVYMVFSLQCSNIMPQKKQNETPP